jgi:hypothetical protein
VTAAGIKCQDGYQFISQEQAKFEAKLAIDRDIHVAEGQAG